MQAGLRPELSERLERSGAALRAVAPGTASLIWGGDNTVTHDLTSHIAGHGLPMMGYARAVELLAGTAPVTVAVAGSHSTTMASAALTCALVSRDSGWILAEAPMGDSAGYDGGGEVLVVDLCPDGSSHETSPPGWRFRTLGEGLSPTVTLITAVDAAPPAFWNQQEALDQMEVLAQRSDTVVVWVAQPGCQELADRLRRHRPGPRVVTVGRGTGMDVQVLGTFWTGEEHRVTVQADGERHTFTVPVAGTNNAMAVAAAWAAGWALGVPGRELVDGLGTFAGVERTLSGSTRKAEPSPPRTRTPSASPSAPPASAPPCTRPNGTPSPSPNSPAPSNSTPTSTTGAAPASPRSSSAPPPPARATPTSASRCSSRPSPTSNRSPRPTR
ncbi:hypothetical protein [Kitasatospora sp. NPDC087315]|uniref:hypothetical protein n=1 Tax=Kitasatospora sp. NPDC087315 TaxID=3364069 RepID=UPI00381799C9